MTHCSPWTAARGVDPIGTAGRYDTFVLVEGPLPWRPDVVSTEPFARVSTTGTRARVLAVAPIDAPIVGRVRVTCWYRETANRFRGIDHEIRTRDLADVLPLLAHGGTGAGETAVGDAPRDLVICTHGSRDRCCGSLGTRLYREVAGRWEGVRARRCSHVGGHRYAPTGYSFPEGRAWAFADRDVLDRVVAGAGKVLALRRHQRGSTALEPYAQVVERALFEHLGWEWLDCDLGAVEVRGGRAGTSTPVSVEWFDAHGTPHVAHGIVAIARQLAVPVCGTPISAATTSHPELALCSFDPGR